jgi:hypothetical protein
VSRPVAALAVLVACLALATVAPVARAQIALGATAPDFTKTRLGGGTWTLSQSTGKVRVLFLLGYG